MPLDRSSPSSDHLNERHPYQDLPFKESYNPKEVHKSTRSLSYATSSRVADTISLCAHKVTRAFGSRAVPKFAELLAMDDLSDEDRASALLELNELLSNQETKYTANTHEILFSCADLAESRSVDVRQNAALVIASLVLYENVCRRPDKVGALSSARSRLSFIALLESLLAGQG